MLFYLFYFLCDKSGYLDSIRMYIIIVLTRFSRKEHIEVLLKNTINNKD